MYSIVKNGKGDVSIQRDNNSIKEHKTTFKATKVSSTQHENPMVEVTPSAGPFKKKISIV